jgi:hypothetical protein
MNLARSESKSKRRGEGKSKRRGEGKYSQLTDDGGSGGSEGQAPPSKGSTKVQKERERLEKLYTNKHKTAGDSAKPFDLKLIKTQEDQDELLKLYEGFLGPKLSDGRVKENDHLEIVQYRLQKGIPERMHILGLKNLGWQEQRYENSLKEHAPAAHQMELKAKVGSNFHKGQSINSSIDAVIVEEGGDDEHYPIEVRVHPPAFVHQWYISYCTGHFSHSRPLQVLRNMEARDRFIRGFLESTFQDHSIEWGEYMYIRRIRLEYGISDYEFEYFAKHLYNGQKSDRSKMEDDKQKQEEKVLPSTRSQTPPLTHSHTLTCTSQKKIFHTRIHALVHFFLHTLMHSLTLSYTLWCFPIGRW